LEKKNDRVSTSAPFLAPGGGGVRQYVKIHGKDLSCTATLVSFFWLQ